MNGRSKAYYEMLDDQAIRKIIRSTSPGMLAADIGTPLALTPNVRKLISAMPGNYAQTFKTSVLTQDILLHPQGATARLDLWVNKHPEGWGFLTGNNKGLVNDLRASARSMDKLRSSNLYQAMEASTADQNVATSLLRGTNVGPKETLALVQNVGEQGRMKLRQGMFHDIVDSVVTVSQKGIPMVDRAALNKIKDEYIKSGAWQHVLSQADREHLMGMQAYIDLAWKGASDAGVSLEAAKAITELKRPSTFISGAHKLAVNALAERIIANPKFVEWVATHNLGKPIVVNTARSKVKFIGLVAEWLAEGTEPGQDFDPFSQGVMDPAMSALKEFAVDPTKVGQQISDWASDIEIPEG